MSRTTSVWGMGMSRISKRLKCYGAACFEPTDCVFVFIVLLAGTPKIQAGGQCE